MQTCAARIHPFTITFGWVLLAWVSGAHADDANYPTTLPDDDPAEAASDPVDAPPIRFELQVVAALTLPNHSEQGSAGLGFGLIYGVGWGDIPLLLGVDFMSINAMARSQTEVNLSVDGETLSATKSARDRVLYFDLWARVQPPYWSVRPYVEGFIGTKVLQTSYALTFDIENSQNDYAKDHDWTSSIGWGVGVDFPELLSLSREGQIALTLGFRRVSGSQAKLERGAQVDGRSVVARHSVATDVTIVMLGVGGRTEL